MNRFVSGFLMQMPLVVADLAAIGSDHDMMTPPAAG
jgi:hypothetical protein